MDTLIVFFAQYVIWLVVLGGLVFWALSPRKIRLGVAALGSMALAYAIAKVVANFWYDPRPFISDGVTPLFSHAADNGFPSDHMLLGAAIASIVFAYNRAWGIALFALAFLVGAARVLSGVHHWLDIAGSIAIAIAATAFVEFCVRAIWRRREAISPSIQ